MANISVTYSFSNGSTADATQVNQNFSDIVAGTSDGTKDFSIAALTLAGTLTANGNVTLGNATSDDITITGSLASTINIKTTTSYDIGTATIGLRAIYLGDAGSAARCTKILGATISSGWTLTLPTGAGSANQILKTDGNGTTSWENRLVGTKTNLTSASSPYSVLSTDEIILCDCSGGAITVNLPAAASNSGKMYYIKKTDSSANAVTLDGNASETIDGATTKKLFVQYDAILIYCDSSNWHILESFSKPICVKASASTTTVGTSDSAVVYTTETVDSHSAYNNATGEFIAPRACRIKVSAHVAAGGGASASAARSNVYLSVTQGGTAKGQTYFQYQVASVTLDPMLALPGIVLDCAANDSVFVTVSRDSAVGSFSLANGIYCTLNIDEIL